MSLARNAQIAASVAGASAVLLGAFGAHALQASLDARALAVWHTAVEYQFWHALALVGVGLLGRDAPTRALRIAFAALSVGIVLFCASLYLLALGAPRGVGVITPFGGVAFIVGWLALLAQALRTT